MEKKNVPKIRFPGFTEPWKQHKLGDYLTIPEKIKAEIKSYNDLMTVKLNLGGVDIGANRETLDFGSTIYYKRKAGQFIYGKQNFFNGSMAIVPKRLDGKATSGDVPALDINGINSNYLYIYVSREDYWKRKEASASGTGSKRIHEKTLFQFDIDVPSLKEQEVISLFFIKLDNLITLHQHKLEHLKKQKKGLLQKMFPKNGEKVPEIRFPGFTDDWEQRKLGEVAEIVGGGTPSTTNEKYWDGDIDWYTPAEINNQIYVEGSERKITELGLKKSSARILPAYKTVLFTSRAGIGKMAILRKSGTTNQGFQSIVLNDDTDSYFIYSMGSNIKEKAEKVASGSTFAEISGKALGNLNFMFPNKTEQKKIGDLFEKLDNLISLHQRKLEKLQNIKKSCLEKMFVV